MSAATGCTLSAFLATCSFTSWDPPLLDSQFAKSPGNVVINDVNGTIPNNALRGLDNSDGYSGTPQLSFDCGFGNGYSMTLLKNSLSSNLDWVEEMMISDCENMVIGDKAFSVLTNMTLLTIMAGSISSISPTAFSGLTNLTTLYFYATLPTSGVPDGLFDGLTGLTTLDMSRTAIYSLPKDLFKDLKHLNTLQLSESSLTTLPQDLFYPLLSLSVLEIGNNWTCDCSLNWLENYMTETGLGSGNCSLPAEYSGFDLGNVIRSLQCTSSATTTLASSASSNTEAEEEESLIWRYCLIGGTSLAILVAIAACIGLLLTRYELEHERKSVKRLQRSFKGKDNAGFEKSSLISVEYGKDNRYHFTQPSPFNKRGKQVTPVRVWTSDRGDDGF